MKDKEKMKVKKVKLNTKEAKKGEKKTASGVNNSVRSK
jgi:hypothetical protein